jgi:hypothetical protein
VTVANEPLMDLLALDPLIAVCDRYERFTAVSEPYARRFDRPAAAFVGRSIEEILGTAVRTLLEPRLRHVLADSETTFERDVPKRTSRSRRSLPIRLSPIVAHPLAHFGLRVCRSAR